MAKQKMRAFETSDGERWGALVTITGASNAMVVFRHPDPQGVSGRGDRYAWHLSNGPESRSVTARLDAGKVLDSLTDADLARLFRRSMPISAAAPPRARVPERPRGGAR